MRKFVFLLLLMGAFGYGLAQPLAVDTSVFGHVPSAQRLTYWFDAASGERQSVTLSQGAGELDVSLLPTGVHTLHCYAVDSAGVAYPTRSAMFFRPPAMGAASAGAMVYWFDAAFASRQSVPLGGGTRLLDVSALPTGMHTLHCYAVGADGRVYPTSSAMFFCPPAMGPDSAGAEAMVYWFDEDFSIRQRVALNGGPQMMDVSALPVGMHTLHCYAVGADGRVYPTSSVMFFRPPYVNTDSVAAQEVVYWFDEDFASRQRAAAERSAVLLMDVSALQVGMHTLHCYAVGRDSTVYPTRSAMFFRPPQMGSDSVAAQEVVYWFDGDYAGRQHVASLSALQTIDVSSLTIGVHTLHCYAVGMDGKVYPTSSTMFFRPPVAGSEGGEGISQYYYWVNEGIDHATRVAVNPVTNPLQWYGLVPMDPQPFRSSYFHFEIDTAQQPHAYAKNTFHTLFMDDMGRFVLGDVTPFIDYHVSQPVVWDTIERGATKTIAVPTNNNIHWFKLGVGVGDSLSFTTNKRCTMQLYAPSGEMVFHASGDSVLRWVGCHSWETGDYYLAVHDAEGSGNMTVSYQWVYRYAVLAWDVHRVGNGGISTITFEGNGFDNIASIALISPTLDTVEALAIHRERISKCVATFDFTDKSEGQYNAQFLFGDQVITKNNLLNVETASDIELDVTVRYPGSFLSGTSAIYSVAITNHGNATAYDVPVEVEIHNTGRLDNISYIKVSEPNGKVWGDVDIRSMIPDTTSEEVISFITGHMPQSEQNGLGQFIVLYDSVEHIDRGYSRQLLTIPPLSQYEFEVEIKCLSPVSCIVSIPSEWITLNTREPDSSSSAPQRALNMVSSGPNAQNTNGVNNSFCCHKEGWECYADVATTALGLIPVEACAFELANFYFFYTTEMACSTNGSLGNRFMNFQEQQINNPTLRKSVVDKGVSTIVNCVVGRAVTYVSGLIKRRNILRATRDRLTNSVHNIQDQIAEKEYSLTYLRNRADEAFEAGDYTRYNSYTEQIASTNADIEDLRRESRHLNTDLLQTIMDEDLVTAQLGEKGEELHTIYSWLSYIKDIREAVHDIAEGLSCANAWNNISPSCQDNTKTAGGQQNPYYSRDPNEIVGYVAESGSMYMPDSVRTVDYFVECENDPAMAQAAAHKVTIADTLSSQVFDLTTFRPTQVTIGENAIFLDGAQNGVYTMDLRPRINALAQVSINYSRTTGVARWTIETLNPITLAPTLDVNVGVLPPNTDGSGIARVYYSIGLRNTVGDGDSVSNQAHIIFDFEDAIATPVWTNVVDAVSPTSRIAYGSMADDTLTLSFQATDNRSGVWRYDVFGRSDSLDAWRLVNTSRASVQRLAVDSLTDFYVVAVDSAGNRESKPAQAEYNTVRGVVGPAVTTWQIQFVNYDNTVLGSYRLPTGAMPAYLGVPRRNADRGYSYQFSGWRPSLAPVTGNAVYRAEYDSLPNSYRVSFYDYDSTLLQEDSLPYGTLPTYYSMIPTREVADSFVYAFVGWEPALAPVTGNAAYRPVFDSMVYHQLPRYLVTFRNWNDSTLQADSLMFGQMPNYWGTEPTRDGGAYCEYRFRGWRPQLSPATGNATYTAVFDTLVHTYPVTFVNFNGAVLQRDTLPYGSMPVYRGNTPARRTTIQYTYQFAGWSPNVDTVRGEAVYTALFDSVFSCISQYHYDDVATCDTVTWRGSQYAATGTYTNTVVGAAYGCDSIYVLNLTVNSRSFTTDFQTACDSYSWHGQSYTASATDVDTLANAADCDSVVTLHLTLHHSNTGSETVTACDSYSWHGQSYMASTTAFDTLTNAVSCDSIVTLNLTLNYSDAVTETIAACDSYSWHGQSYTASATDVDTLANAAGCDSVVTLHLTINYSSTGIDLQTACDSLLWHGNVYTSSTDTPTFTMQSSAGCDSVVTLHLTLHNATRNELELADCDSIVWSEMTFYSSGDTCVILTNSAGCDSLNMLHLSVGHSERDTIVDTAVGSYEWNGTTYTESGEYLFSSQTEAGCDSIITLILTITQTEGILPRDMEQATLYPNPTTGKITIDGVKAVRIEVYDLDGRMLCTFSNTNSFDISKLPSGTYFIRIFSPQGEARQRVIKY